MLVKRTSSRRLSWGYERSGTNSISRPLDFDLSVDIEKYKVLEKFEIAFILEQNSG